MADTFRALCAELVDIITAHANLDDYAVGDIAEMLARARAALAKADEPAVPEEGREPAAWTEGVCGDGAALLKDGVMVPIEAVVRELNEGARARAVLARWGNLKGSLTSSPPADGEVAELTGQLIEAANGAAAMGWDQHAKSILRAAELLQRPMADLSPTAYALLTLAAELES